MTPARLATILGAAIVLLTLVLSLWALGIFAISRPSLDLGEPIVVPTVESSISTTKPGEQPTFSPTVDAPILTTSPPATASPTMSRTNEAIPVPKPPAPSAGNDGDEWDDDDDPFDDDTDDGSPEDDVDDN